MIAGAGVGIDAEPLAHHALAAWRPCAQRADAALLVQHAFGMRDDDLRPLPVVVSASRSVSRIRATFLATQVTTPTIAVLFGITLLYSAYQSVFQSDLEHDATFVEDPLATKLKLNGDYPGPQSQISYSVRNVPSGFSLMFGAGCFLDSWASVPAH